MAFKLTKAESDLRDDLISRLNNAKMILEAGIEAFNSELEKQASILNQALRSYNELLSETQSFVEGIASRAEDEISEKSDKWQESDNGSAAQDWQNDWSGAASEFEPIELEFPDQLDPDLENHADVLEDLPTEFNP